MRPRGGVCGSPRVDMRCTCNYAAHMSKMIQIRNVPDAVHRKLKMRAAEAGLSLSDYLLADLRRSVEQPTSAELWARIRSREAVTAAVSAASAVRAERDAR